MTYQKLIVPIDHGNRNLKTENHVFTSGIIESDCRPVLGEYMYYNGRYYALSDQRIPYMRTRAMMRDSLSSPCLALQRKQKSRC